MQVPADSVSNFSCLQVPSLAPATPCFSPNSQVTFLETSAAKTTQNHVSMSTKGA
jgi:hypothetical protein